MTGSDTRHKQEEAIYGFLLSFILLYESQEHNDETDYSNCTVFAVFLTKGNTRWNDSTCLNCTYWRECMHLIIVCLNQSECKTKRLWLINTLRIKYIKVTSSMWLYKEGLFLSPDVYKEQHHWTFNNSYKNFFFKLKTCSPFLLDYLFYIVIIDEAYILFSSLIFPLG